MVKNPQPKQETQETQVQSLSWEDALELEMATWSRILVWKIPWPEELTKESNKTELLSIHRASFNVGVLSLYEVIIWAPQHPMRKMLLLFLCYE